MDILVDENAVGENLTLKQERFCRNYTQNDLLFGNGTLSYAEAYGIDLNQEDEWEEEEENDLDDFEDDEDSPPKRTKRKTHRLRNPIYDNCASHASRLLKNGKIQARVTTLLNEMLNDREVDAELAKLIKAPYTKGSDRVAAIREYNNLRARIIKKVDHTTGGKPFNNLTDEELHAIIRSKEGTSETGTSTETPDPVHSV